MGCWNGTCGISNLLIECSEDMVIVFMKNNLINYQKHYGNEYTFENGCCYSDTYYEPKYLPIFGKYNDYGSIEDVNIDWNTEHIRKHYFELCGGTLGNNRKSYKESHNLDTIEGLVDAIERGHLYYTDKDEVEQSINLYFTMIRKDVWDSVVEIMKKEKSWFWSSKGSTKDITYFTHYTTLVNDFFLLMIL